MFGSNLSARRFDNQRVEAVIKCEVPSRPTRSASVPIQEREPVSEDLLPSREKIGHRSEGEAKIEQNRPARQKDRQPCNQPGEEFS